MSAADLIYYSIVICIVVFFISRLLGGILSEYFGIEKERKNINPEEFEKMIAQKEQTLRASANLQTKSTESQPKDFSFPHNENQYILELLEDSKWGSGKSFKNLQNELTEKFQCNISENEVNLYFSQIITEQACIAHIQDFPSVTNTFKDYLIQFIFISIFPKKSELNISTAKSLSVERDAILNAYYYKVLSKSKSLQDIIIQLSEKDLSEQFNSLSKQEEFKSLISWFHIKKSPFYLSKTNIEIDLLSISEISNFLFYIKEPDINSMDSLLEVFSLKSMPAKEQLKSSYKSMVKFTHPDMISNSISPELKKLSTENFRRLQKAYDILLEKVI
jgi:hypothetical protein